MGVFVASMGRFYLLKSGVRVDNHGGLLEVSDYDGTVIAQFNEWSYWAIQEPTDQVEEKKETASNHGLV